MIRMHVIKMTPNEERRGEGLVMTDENDDLGASFDDIYEQSTGGEEGLQSAMNRLAAKVNRLRNKGA